MKKIIIITLMLLGVIASANAQKRIKINDDVSLVTYGNTTVIEDKKNQRTISMEIVQDGIDKRNNEKFYKVVCGKWSKRVVKDALIPAIQSVLASAATSVGATAIVIVAGKIANHLYDDFCESQPINIF